MPRQVKTNRETQLKRADSTHSDLNSWLTKQEAARALNTSTRTVEREAINRGRIKSATRRRPDNRLETCYRPEDIDILAKEWGIDRNAVPAPVLSPASVSSAATELVHGPPLAAHPLQALLDWKRVRESLLLTVPEAAQVSGFSKARLRALMRNGDLPYIVDRGWKCRRSDLVRLIERGNAADTAAPLPPAPRRTGRTLTA